MSNYTLQPGSPGRLFYPVMAILCLVISIIAFIPTYLGPIAKGSYIPASSNMHLHGITAFAWLLLFTIQPTLIALDKRVWHRRLGTLGIAIAAVTLITGFLVLRDTLSLGFHAGDIKTAETLPVLRVLALLGFLVFVGAALNYRRKPDYHYRLMFLATLWLLQAPFLRFWENIIGLNSALAGPMILVLQIALMSAAAIQDKRTINTVHVVYRWWIPLTVLLNIIVVGISETETSRSLVRGLAGF